MKFLNANDFFLNSLTYIYKTGYYIDRLIHALNSYKSDVPVISIGNIIVGGAGKTTMTIQIGNYLMERGKKVVILSRGYKRKVNGNLIVKDCDIEKYGDEPVLIYSNAKIPIIVGKNRVKSIKKAKRKYKNIDIFLLDDGYQYYRLIKNVNILLLDATTSLNNYKLLPIGRLREPLSEIKRADMVVITRTNLCDRDKVLYLKSILKGLNITKIFEAPLGIDNWFDLNGKIVIPPKNATILSGIGNPFSFEKILERNFINIKKHYKFKDHHKYSFHEIKDKMNKNSVIITTEKDAIKIIKIIPKEYRKSIIYPKVMFLLPFYFYEEIEKRIKK